jgi:hypothetical protein
VELVDTLALGASAARREGSSPFIPTKTVKVLIIMSNFIESEPQLDRSSSLSCTSVRFVITQSATHFRRTEQSLDVNDQGYDEQEKDLSQDLDSAFTAFEKRPVDCLMTVDCDDRYDCEKCNFTGDLSLSAQASDGLE